MSKEVETMKKFLLAVAVLCIGTMAFAGPNAGGTLILHNAGLVSATNNSSTPCPQGAALTSCAAAVTRVDGTDFALLKVFAAFSSTASPRLMGVAWGVHYDANIAIESLKNCGDFEIADGTWPASDTGNSVTFNIVQTAPLTVVYVFSAYGDGNPGTMCVRDNPDPLTGGNFGDDVVPANLDPIAGYGCMGFATNGSVVCPYEPPQPGACCDPQTAACTFILEADCLAPLTWRAGVCEPVNPCPLPPSGACCDPVTGACTYVPQVQCVTPLIWHAGITCTPNNPCPQPGACCDMTLQTCAMVMQGDCVSPLVWKGGNCTPTLCLVVPVQHSSWGQIKNLYR